MRFHSIPFLLLPLLPVAACGSGGAEAAEASRLPAARAGAPAVVDSVVPIAVALERFRADIRPVPRTLSGGAESPEALAEQVVRLVAAGDTLGFLPLTVNRGEFAYLYYESTPQSRPPYELPPALMWFQLQQENRTGLFRLLRELGGKPLTYEALLCDGPPRALGENLLRTGCRVRFSIGGEDDPREMPLFGALLERDGRVKLLSLGNDF